MALVREIESFAPEMTAWRRDIHAHPEMGFQEHRTAAFVASQLKQYGIEVHEGVGKTGVVGVLRSGKSGRTVGLRADMDALPIVEANTFAHKSTKNGVMHACGHDGHTTMLLGAARYLAASRRFDGTVHFIFQPAEEGIGGAKAMIDDGLFKRFPCEAVFGMHNRPGMPLGRFAVRSGPMMAGGAFFDIDIEGVGSHGARPESGVDPVLVAAHVTTALQSIVARNVRPVDTAVLSVTQIHSGDAYNVIPQRARLSGTARCFSNEVMSLIEKNLQAIGRERGGGLRRESDDRLPGHLSAADQRREGGRVRRVDLQRHRRRRARQARSGADHGVGGLRLHAGRGAGLLHQHRQWRRNRSVRGAQPVVRFQ